MDLDYWSIGLLVEFRGGFLCIFGFLWIRNLLVDEIMVVSFFGLYLKFSGSGSILVFLFFINFIWIVV